MITQTSHELNHVFVEQEYELNEWMIEWVNQTDLNVEICFRELI